ncbi:BREX-1 system adenine-specific DNA-methyltransferase PglX [Clostridium fallax]|uniref:site-specific DNA-methyltransferase (adenine-specific) n=1 Tax=Clostridium fallax TaxID=1533 RepID=A0A1M4YMT5_9CLOT|nr:BREX-1 system adenine-specific DNA-methyltransferase PglX [Clostridium fallax]SHF06696.1 N-6 DNA Methylase [Clostridium fallax]SQB06458.1 N-6 DNA Methylase [Clostridium fallax]
MDKNKIKSFAIWSRRNLIEAVKDRAKYIGIFIDNEGEFKALKAKKVQGGFSLENTEKVLNLSYDDREILIDKINEHTNKIKGFEQVMEEVAYTWFNRFMGLRYMEVNDFLPSGVRVLSSEVEGKKEPDVLTKVSEIIDELNLNANEIYDLLDTGDTLDREKAYRTILVKQCNELGKIIPQMFEKISDYTELLLPDNLLEESSVIRKMVEDIEESDWLEEVEIIGWMYQYYISEKKDEVFAALKKNVKITKENIPAATQLFTPKWIVKYMLENSLGRLWLEGHPNQELQKEFKYYLEEAEQEPEVDEELKKIREEHAKLKPEDIKVLDPCMGSGHILVYAFDVLYEIYKTAGYSEREIPRMILQNNLYGLDIDDRAAQLASFALIMKARHYNRRLFREIEREHLELNLCAIQESNSINREAIDYFVNENEELRKDVEYLIKVFTDAKEYGSILEVQKVNFDFLKQRLKEIEDDENLIFGDYRKMLLDNLPMIIKQTEIMSRKYEVCVTNPPYIGVKGLNDNIKKYILIKKWDKYKGDLFTIFMKRNLIYTKKNGHLGFMTPYVWMFIKIYNELREDLIQFANISSLVQLEYSSFEDATVPICCFTLKNRNFNENGIFIRLEEFKGFENQEIKYLEAKNNVKVNYMFYKKNDNFSQLEGCQIAYWISNELQRIFKSERCIADVSEPKMGLSTGDNEKFIRNWYEVVSFDYQKGECCSNVCKWYPLNKGGEYRRWYGNNVNIINWANNGTEIKQLSNSIIRNEKYYFKKCITWTDVSSKGFTARYSDEGFIFADAGPCLFVDETKLNYILGLLNSKLSINFLEIINPTVHFKPGNIGRIPFILNNCSFDKVKFLVMYNIKLARNEWDSFEISWDFRIHPLLELPYKGNEYKIENLFIMWEDKCEENFKQLKYNEEELNRIFIDIYGLQNEVTPEVLDKDITIRKANRERDIKSFISYAVGCMMGRYSIDAEGLIYAGGYFNDKWNIDDKRVRKIEKDEDGNIVFDSWVDATLLPDGDNIIPITEGEYFEDDIVSRFIEFVKTVYGEDTLEENLDFIADSIGRKASETARQAIRRYFIKDFYKDHLKVYQKRPIYWMFESGKNDGFRCLIYMHRYNEQTVAKVRTDYLHTLQRKYEAEINRLQLVVDSEEYTAKDRTAAKKKIDRISKQIEECREYDKVVAHLANEKISIDLDDGVKVNYAKFQDIKVINSKGKETKMNLLAKI